MPSLTGWMSDEQFEKEHKPVTHTIEVSYLTSTLGGQPIGGGIRKVEAPDVLSAIREVARLERESWDMPRATILPDLAWVDGERVPEPSPELRAMWYAAADWRESTIATDGGIVIAEQRHVELTTTFTGPECDGEDCDELEHRPGCALYLTLAQRIRAWDEGVEDGGLVEDGDFEERVKPYDGGIMLAVADVLDAYGPLLRREEGAGPRFAAAMNGLRETAEAVIDDGEED